MQVAGTGSGVWLQAAVLPDKRHRMLLVNRSLQVSHQLKDILKLENTYTSPCLAQSSGLLHAGCMDACRLQNDQQLSQHALASFQAFLQEVCMGAPLCSSPDRLDDQALQHSTQSAMRPCTGQFRS